jgi:multiple sugar transport system ATP-binding protein
MASVRTKDLTKVFAKGGRGAVDTVTLESRDGEFLVLLGPSGSGKTTLLRMIAGLEDPTSGSVLIGEKDVTALAPRERRIAMVFQSYALYPHLSIYDNIAFPLRAQKVPRDLHRGKVEQACALLGISHLLERKPRELSGGERQRAALARALVREPTVFLLDEPLSNLDAKLRASAREELQDFHRRVGTTTLYVTHDQVEAMAMGDRIAVMNHGRVRQIGTPTEVYDEPADTFVATFLGSPPMNLLSAAEGIVGVRPEHLVPSSGSAGPEVSLRVRHVEYLGAEWLVYGVVNPGRFTADQEVVSRLPSTFPTRFEVGSTQVFAVTHPHFFDPKTEARIPGGRLS